VKTAEDPRHLRRIKAFKSLFAHTFTDQEHFNHLAEKTAAKTPELDDIINQAAPEWPISQINKIDLAILRLAIYELLYKLQTPPKVIIDEAVEIAKRYGGQSSSSFVNGALATALKLTKRDI
jgi:transcription antitermination protein NusB